MFTFQCWLEPNPFPSTPKTGQSKCCPNRLLICPGWTTAFRFIGRLNHSHFWKLSGRRQMCPQFPLFTWRLRQDDSGRARESAAGSGGNCQAVGTNLNSVNKVLSAAAQFGYTRPGMAPFHIFRQRLSLWLTPKYRGGSADKKRDTIFNISRQSKIGTVCTRLIITKWLDYKRVAACLVSLQ